MKLARSLRPALRALAAHRLRVALALSGVAIGVAAVLRTGALGAGAEREVARSLETMGTNLLVVPQELPGTSRCGMPWLLLSRLRVTILQGASYAVA